MDHSFVPDRLTKRFVEIRWAHRQPGRAISRRALSLNTACPDRDEGLNVGRLDTTRARSPCAPPLPLLWLASAGKP